MREPSLKKTFKVIAIIIGTFVIVFAVVLLIFIKNLPSSWQIKQAMTPRTGKNPQFAKPVTDAKSPAPKAGENLPAKNEVKVRNEEDRVDEGKELGLKALKEDFLNERQPLASVCKYLGAAGTSRFLRGDENASSKEFMKKLTAEDKDPLIESAAPVFRYLLRLPQVKDLLTLVEQSQAENDRDLLKKTEFYGQIALAAKDIRSNKANLDLMLMRTYNMYSLSRAVAKRPELARDPATLSFCEQIEKNTNMNLDFDVDQQAQELQKFLDYAKVTPQEIGYDPNYRSDVKFEFQNSSLVLQNIWVEKLFAEDIAKAKRQVAKPLPPAE
jgi:hypothetical protein